MPSPLEQRVGIFIDVQNMFYATKNLYNSKLNFARLLDYIARGRPLVRATAYVVQTPEIDQSSFLAMLHSNGYEIRSKELKHRPDGSAKGDWDMGLALDTLAMAERLDTIAIVSGDGDFVELVNVLKARGVRVEVYSFPYSTSEELRWAATEYVQMGTEIVMNPQPRPYGPRDEAGRDGYNRDGDTRESYGRENYGPRDHGRENGYAAARAGYGARDETSGADDPETDISTAER